MKTDSTPNAAVTSTDTPQVLIRICGEGVVELHFTDPLTRAHNGSAAVADQDYRERPAQDLPQSSGYHVAYRLFWPLNEVTGLEIATAEYRKVTLTFGQVYLGSPTLLAQVMLELEVAVKQYSGPDTIIIWP